MGQDTTPEDSIPKAMPLISAKVNRLLSLEAICFLICKSEAQSLRSGSNPVSMLRLSFMALTRITALPFNDISTTSKRCTEAYFVSICFRSINQDKIQ